MRSTASGHLNVERFVLAFFTLTFIAFPFSSSAAQTPTAQDSLPSCGFAQVIHGTLPFPQVELVSRFHSVGLWRGGDITLKPWIEVSEKAYLGIDQFGRVLQVLKLDDRTVAYVLSGERQVREIFYLAPGALVAIDKAGQLLLYSAAKWSNHNLKHFAFQAIRNFGASQCLVAAGLAAYSWFAEVALDSPELIASFGLATVSGLMIQGFRASTKFEAENEITDGFEPLNLSLEGFHHADFVRGSDGSIVDYVRGDQSLMSILGQANLGPVVSFNKTCEHDLLPRGIPPGNYEPNLN
jgi:hypothetical protein